jgi:DNA end-binding protein Ku
MPRPVWKGHISFGLVNVPVVLYSAEQRVDLSFRLIDSQNSARVRYERVNEETGEEVPWDRIVKGYEYDDNNYVLLSEDELERASVEMTRTIEIQQFINLDDIDVRYFDRPYVLVPDKHGEKGYVLLREAIARSKKAGIATVVIRARQHLAALLAVGDGLVLELLRYSQELRGLDDFEFPSGDLKSAKVTKKEIELAEQLIGGMTAKWNAAQYHDEYRDVLMKLIEKKIKSGQTEAIASGDDEQAEPKTQTIDFMEVLKKSLSRSSSRPQSKPAAVRRSANSRKRKTVKRRAG